MGLPDIFNSVIDKARRNFPDVATPVSKASKSSYGLGRAAVLKIDKVVRVDGSQKLKYYIPGPEARQKIGALALNIAACPLGKEAFKQIPGGGLAYETYKWWFQSVQDDDKTKGYKQAGTHKVGADAYLKYEKRVVPHGHARKSGGSPKALDLAAASVKAEKPEDVLSDFIQNGFMGRALVKAEKPEDVLSDFIQNGFIGGAFLHPLFFPNVGTAKTDQEEGIP